MGSRDKLRELSREYYYRKQSRKGLEVVKYYKTVNVEADKVYSEKQENLIWELRCLEKWISTNSCLHKDFEKNIMRINNLKIKIK